MSSRIVTEKPHQGSVSKLLFVFYYVAVSVLLGIKPFVKFIRNYIWDRSDIFSIFLASNDINDIISRPFPNKTVLAFA